MTGVAKSVARLCVGQRRAQFRDVTPSSPAATASFSGLHAATSCQKGTNTNTASLPARCAGHTPNPPRQMRWRWRKLISTIPQKKLYYNTSKSYIGFIFYKEYVGAGQTTYTPSESTPLSPRVSERALHSLCERALHSLCVRARDLAPSREKLLRDRQNERQRRRNASWHPWSA